MPFIFKISLRHHKVSNSSLGRELRARGYEIIASGDGFELRLPNTLRYQIETWFTSIAIQKLSYSASDTPSLLRVQLRVPVIWTIFLFLIFIVSSFVAAGKSVGQILEAFAGFTISAVLLYGVVVLTLLSSVKRDIRSAADRVGPPE